MQAGKFLAVHPHAAGVERTRDEPADDVGAETFFADVLFASVAAIEDARPRAESLVVEGVGDLGERGELRGHCKDAAQRGGFDGMRAQALSRLVIEVAERHLSARPESALRLFVELDADLVGRVQPVVFRHAHDDVIFEPA